MIFRILFSGLLALLVSLPAVAADNNEEAWDALREGRAVLMLRHALAPGTGDPGNFDINDCSTQRNLNDVGREQARAWKPFLADHGITEARVFSSQWCRCMDTATGMNMGEVTEWRRADSDAADDFSGEPARRRRAGYSCVPSGEHHGADRDFPVVE